MADAPAAVETKVDELVTGSAQPSESPELGKRKRDEEKESCCEAERVKRNIEGALAHGKRFKANEWKAPEVDPSAPAQIRIGDDVKEEMPRLQAVVVGILHEAAKKLDAEFEQHPPLHFDLLPLELRQTCQHVQALRDLYEEEDAPMDAPAPAAPSALEEEEVKKAEDQA